jgi:hypothetical protein
MDWAAPPASAWLRASLGSLGFATSAHARTAASRQPHRRNRTRIIPRQTSIFPLPARDYSTTGKGVI